VSDGHATANGCISTASVTVAGCFAAAEHTSVRQEVPQKLMDGTVVITNLQGVLTRPLAEHAIARTAKVA
jgi:hypothetical protein